MIDRDASPDRIERAWRDEVYRGDRVPQLTARALATGAVLGVLMGLSNLYVGLKIGWSLGVVVTASMLGFAVWSVARRVGLARTLPSELELNAMASTASAAGYSTGSTLASAIAAYVLVAGHQLPLPLLTAWILAVSLLGLCMAMPLKRQLVNVEQLPFPSGAAAAEAIRSLHAGEGSGRARPLLVAFAIGLALKWLTSAMPIVAPALALPSRLPMPAWADAIPALATATAYTFTLELSVLLPAAGTFVGWHVGWSMLLGAAICWGIVAPRLHGAGVLPETGYTAISAWSVWPGTTMMVVAGLLVVALQHRTLVRVVRGLGDLGRSDVLADIEVPPRWFVGGSAIAGLACIVLLRVAFDVPLILAVLAVALAGLLALVAARITGETDITPPGPLGKLTQLTFGALMPGHALPNLMTAGVSAGAAASAADLLTDLKSGWLLGADPRRQFIAQAVGVLVGAIAIVPVFRYVLVPSADVLGTETWPAPAAKMWASVAALVSSGGQGLPATAIWAMAIAAGVAVVLVVLPRVAPRLRSWVPSPMGLGLAFVLPASSSIAFFVGGALAFAIARRSPDAIASRVVPIAAGLIAGESLMGIAAALLAAAFR
jgi:uncharacterized oligopeptide transporter (OPT) family protein